MLDSASIYHLIALSGTLVVEGVGMALWASIATSRSGRAIVATIVVNLITHTLFWYSQPVLAPYWPGGLYAAEAVIVVIEGATYGRVLSLSRFTPWLLSFALNLASFSAGQWMWQQLM